MAVVFVVTYCACNHLTLTRGKRKGKGERRRRKGAALVQQVAWQDWGGCCGISDLFPALFLFILFCDLKDYSDCFWLSGESTAHRHRPVERAE